jgi:hypothetical protein
MARQIITSQDLVTWAIAQDVGERRRCGLDVDTLDEEVSALRQRVRVLLDDNNRLLRENVDLQNKLKRLSRRGVEPTDGALTGERRLRGVK